MYAPLLLLLPLPCYVPPPPPPPVQVQMLWGVYRCSVMASFADRSSCTICAGAMAVASGWDAAMSVSL